MALYADVILPLPIYSSFTYAVPEQMQGQVRAGSRVIVPFGRGNSYTGIVEAVHGNPPKTGEAKEIILPLDPEPILRHPQLKFWRWMSEYYLCSPGEVMKAALPAALKVEGESWVSPMPEPDEDLVSELSEKEALVYAHVVHAKKARVSEVEKAVGISAPRVVINSLLEKGLIQVMERLVDKYVTKKVSLVTLTCLRGDQEALHSFFGKVTRSRAQEQMLVAYLDMSGWLNPQGELVPVERKALLEKCKASPAILKALTDKGIMQVEQVRVNRFSDGGGNRAAQLPVLSDPQQKALRDIRRSMGAHLVTLLRGVTGSGKTEIYSHLIHDSLEHGDHVLMLVPEISLTTQLTTRLRRIFGDRLLVYHSKFSDSERVDIWRRLLTSHEPMLILGVRSSIFLPFPKLGLIVVDEEHESSYKQFDPAPRYNARDSAIMLATMHGAKVLLGSATPAVDTYYKATTGKYGLVELLTRFSEVPLPEVEVIDMREKRKRKEVTGPFSSTLLAATRRTMEASKQAILFQNRRGFAPVVVCNTCGWTPSCPNCDISMVYHRREGNLRCHYCGYSVPLPALCPACETNALQTYGYGTERLADTLHSILPEVPMARMDLDTTRSKDAYQEIIEGFSNHDTRILIGTQMVSKGLDFSDVTFVGIVNADTLLNFPDFRSNERAYCTLEQVAGRAGRRQDTGRVMIQTTNPLHPAIQAVRAHDYLGFYRAELAQRQQFFYPPFAKIINIYLRHKEEKAVESLAQTFAAQLRAIFGARLLGPDTPGVSRIAGMHIRTLMLKIEPGASMSKVKQLLREAYATLAASTPASRSLRLHYDVDPA